MRLFVLKEQSQSKVRIFLLTMYKTLIIRSKSELQVNFLLISTSLPHNLYLNKNLKWYKLLPKVQKKQYTATTLKN